MMNANVTPALMATAAIGCCHKVEPYLDNAVAMGIQGPFELQHIPILLRIYELIREVHGEAI